MIALWLGVGAFVAAWAVVLDLALVRQGQRPWSPAASWGSSSWSRSGAAIAAIIGAVQVDSNAGSDTDARTRAAIAVGLAAVSLLLMTLAGLELYSIGLDTL